MQKRSRLLAVAVVGALVLPGCEFGRHYVNKPWGKGTYIPALVCGAIGAGVGVAIQNERAGTSRFTNQTTGQTISKSDDKNLFEGALIGAPIGAAVCGLLGHYLLDPEPVTPSPPPPPPPPTPTPTPESLPPPVRKRIVLRGVNFDFDKTAIRPDSRPVLDEAVALLQENPRVLISVEGHTDAVGTELYNERLSVRRAEAVFRYLVNHGVAPERMQVVGYGESRPVAANTTAQGRAQNRRVELHVVKQPQASEP